jgi:transmembrane 9 superfamily protein 2/4
MPLKFRQDSITSEYCQKTLSEEEHQILLNIIQLGLFGEFSIDQLPLWSQLGKAEGSVYIFTSFHLTVLYNGQHIIEAKMIPDNPQQIYDPEDAKLSRNLNLRLSFSVSWVPTDQPFESRLSVYSKSGLFPTSIHWLGLLNSSIMILLICSLIMCLLFKSLRKDLISDSNIFDLPSGWKNVKMEALAAPVLNPVLSALVGMGSEVFALFLVKTIMVELEVQNQDLIIGCFIIFNGAVGAWTTATSQQEVKGWLFAILMTGACFPLTCIVTFLLLEAFGVSLHLFYLISWLLNPVVFLSISRNLRRQNEKFHVKGSVFKKKPWYLEQSFLVPIGGILPFISIALEFSYLLRSLLTYQFYVMHGFLMISFVQLVVCVACVGVVNSYLTLQAEDSKWQWCSFLTGGVLGAYVLTYSVYFYVFVNGYEGLFRFFALMTGICLLIFVAFGFVAFTASKMFVRKLYERVKHD